MKSTFMTSKVSMQISKSSWHYRFNSQLQGSSFRDRATKRKFTTCSYIRTTLRSALQSVCYALLIAIAFLVVGFTLSCAVYVPIAAVFGYSILKSTLLPCAVGWAWIMFGVFALISNKYGRSIRSKLSAHQERKLSILEQRIKDGKEGICTIVEVV